jgi:hypothetical protein
MLDATPGMRSPEVTFRLCENLCEDISDEMIDLFAMGMLRPLRVAKSNRSLQVNKKSQAPCGETVRLFSAYTAVALEFATAMAKLEDRIGVSSMAAHESLRRNTEVLRIKCEGARLDLETHVFKHGCEGSIPISYAALFFNPRSSASSRATESDTSTDEPW